MFGGAGVHIVSGCVSGRMKKVGYGGWGAYSFGRWYSVSVSWEDLCAAGLAIWCKCLG